MADFQTKQLNARLSEKAYTNWTQQGQRGGLAIFPVLEGWQWI